MSGDDLYLIDGAPHSMGELFALFTNFSRQYRPLTHSLFASYRLFLPNTFMILLLDLVLMWGVASLFFINLKRLIGQPLAALLAVATMISPIFYYHFFAIASLNNILILIFLLSSLLLINFKPQPPHSKKIIIGGVLLFLAIFSKESFLVNALLFYLILWQNLKRRKLVVGISITSLIILVYLLLRFTLYQSTGDYALGNSFTNAIGMSVDIGSWLIGYPRGWQYGAPEPKTWLTYVTSLISLVSLGLIFAKPKQLIKTWKTQILFVITLGSSIAPFFIIDRALVFYVDVAILILIFWLAYNHQDSNKKWLFFLPVVLSLVVQFFIYYPQWHKYSFVANANTTVQNYRQALFDNDFYQYEQICIINNTRGSWGTEDGEAARLLYGYKGKINSVKEDVIPIECKLPNTLLLRNEMWEFYLFE